MFQKNWQELIKPQKLKVETTAYNTICFEVDDIEASLRDFAAQGARLIDEKPRPGAGGHLVAFVHPKAAHGVLVELKQK